MFFTVSVQPACYATSGFWHSLQAFLSSVKWKRIVCQLILTDQYAAPKHCLRDYLTPLSSESLLCTKWTKIDWVLWWLEWEIQRCTRTKIQNKKRYGTMHSSPTATQYCSIAQECTRPLVHLQMTTATCHWQCVLHFSNCEKTRFSKGFYILSVIFNGGIQLLRGLNNSWL